MVSAPTLEILPEAECKLQEEPMGPGVLLGERGKDQVAFPLQGISVQARISGPLASVEVSQEFSNPYPDTIEAVYIFPLPHGAGVYRFRMKVGDRTVDGIVQERGQARETYEEGIRQGHRSALLEQERDNVFTVRVGNLPPGEKVSIEMAYAHRLEANEAENVFRFPLVVAPRYIPGDPQDGTPTGEGTAPDTHKVPDASRITPPVLLPGLRSGASLTFAVHLETGGLMPVRLACSQHAVTQSADQGDLVVELARQDELLDRDFILKFRLAGEQPKALLLCGDKHFLLTILPPSQGSEVRTPRDVVFLLDRSGSMGGAKMDSAKKSLIKFLDTLEADDRFSVLAFDDKIESLSNGSLLPHREIARARTWINTIDARGGTEIAAPMQQALSLKADAERLLCIVLITDGQVGNEPEIYKMVQTSKSPARIFTLGVDTAVNDAFLRRVAQLGRGTCELVTPGEALEKSLDRLARETGRPLITGIDLVDRGLGFDPQSLAPEKVPDLFAARPVAVTGAKTGSGGVKLTGHLAGQAEPWNVTIQPVPSQNAALGVVWARERVGALEDRLRLEKGISRDAVEKQILDLALEYQLLTRFTAFVLVDRQEVVNPKGELRTVVQPVQMPAQWEMSLDSAAPPAGFASAPAAMAFGAAPPPMAAPMPAAPMLLRAASESIEQVRARRQDSDEGSVILGMDVGARMSPLKAKKKAEKPRDTSAPASEVGTVLRDLIQMLKQWPAGQTRHAAAEALLQKLLELLEAKPELQKLVVRGKEIVEALQRSDAGARRLLDKWLKDVQNALDGKKPFWKQNI